MHLFFAAPGLNFKLEFYSFFFIIFREVYMEADSFYEENDRFKKYIQ